MAMILQKSRLRLTEAIFFGFPPSAVGSGFIKADGSVPLTADWNAGNFNINSRNSTLWFNVVAFGADRTGVGTSTAAVVAALAAASAGGVIYFPRGTYLIDQQITIATAGIMLMGDGPDATTIDFTPAPPPGPRTCFKFIGVTTINNCAVSGMRFISNDVVMAKTAIEVIDAVNFFVDRVNIVGPWTGASSVGLKFNGRQIIKVNRCDFNDCDLPVVIGVNPNLPGPGQISFDHSSITDSQFVVTAGLNNQAITVEDGVLLSNCEFARLALVRGNGGFKFDNTTLVTASYEVAFKNIRTEQSNSNTGYAIDITATTGGMQSLTVENVRADPVANGIRLSLCAWPKVSNFSYGGVGTFLNLAANVSNFTIQNSFRQAGSTITDASTNPAGIDLVSGGNPGVTTFGTLAIPSGAPPLSVGSTSQFRVDATGQLGLGGTTPDQVLTMTGLQHFVGGTPTIYSEPAAPGATTLSLSSLASGVPGYLANGASMRLESDAANNGTIRFATTEFGVGNLERMTITNQGNIGIKATTPTRALDLNGPQRWRGIAAPPVSELNSGVIYFDAATNKLKASLNGSAYVDVVGSAGLTGSGVAGQVAYWDGLTSLASPSAVYIDPINNRVGINVPVPSYPLDIDGGDINLTNASQAIRVAGSIVFQAEAATANVAIGGSNGSHSTGDTAVGFQALRDSTGGGAGGNTAVGSQALRAITTGDSNSAVGNFALGATTVGTDNVAIGLSAGATNTTGTNNIFIGSNADAAVGNLTNAGAIGANASIAQDNSLHIGGSILAVGIATSTPKTTLQVNGSFAILGDEVTLVNGLNSDITTIVPAAKIRIVGPTGAFSIGGFNIPTGIIGVSGPVNGQILYVFNSEAQQMTIVNEDLLSTAIVRIATLTGGDVVLRNGTSAATFVYDDSIDRWVLQSSN